ncbi:hypothetical protein R70723_28545 [Paenibacillus sp. FSL R7-0273]|uniref:DUF948 domain-containing protein n=1 Tax=Paenibacillus sp. FSL R7-0273 TaxID=1536772 RepID=UPI0004F61838|nr:DUF948 domain-containing protein [Paenibacillus sp. FSL R7-0273]AIQ49392.1 hypothetical protein R70723_28545 [Paenibacillus sp. FSL R7-0273]OMF85298.1 hypothetical protein BK144_28150 [Paenibacillus sp. FSL R7-0273]
MIIELSVALVAVAFAVLVFFLIKTLNSAKESLDKVSQTLQEVQKTVDELTYEIKTTVRHANDITADVQGKIQKIDPIVDSVKNLGDVMNELTLTVKQVSVTVIEKYRKSRELKQKAGSVAIDEKTLTPAEERTVKSYDTAYAQKAPGKIAMALKGVDTAAAIWQKFRH